MEIFFWTLFIIILVDGVKLLVESFAHGKAQQFEGNSKEVTVIIAAHNEEKTIFKTLISVGAVVPLENIIVVDDESTDKTAEIIEKWAPDVTLVTIKHKGKVGAIHSVLKYVKTPYVLLLDADIEFKPDFVIPTKALEDGHATAVSFNVIPKVEGVGFFNRLWMNLQKHEYAKSMQIGKRFNNVTKSVHCISGAAGLFRTDRLIELSAIHTTIFPGEDLERTLLELDARGEVIFADDEVLTDVPQTFFALARQRIVGWWPGLWRNIWLFSKIVIRRKEPFRLRYELVYELFSLFTDPLKLIALYGLIAGGAWTWLLFIYLVYLVLEILVSWRVYVLTGKYVNMRPTVVVLYPIYSALQMVFRALAFFVFVWKKLFTNEWRKVVVTTLLLLAPLVYAQEKKDWAVGYQYARVHDQPMQRNFNNHQFFVGWKGVYSEVSTDPYNRINAGMYYGNWWVDFRYRWTDDDVQTKLQYEHWFGPFVPRVMGGIFYQTRVGEMFPIGGLGASFYVIDELTLNADVIHEWGRVYGTTYIGSVRWNDRNESGCWGTFGGSMTNYHDYGTFLQVGYEWFYVHADFYQNYDFTTFDRMSIGAGVIVKF